MGLLLKRTWDPLDAMDSGYSLGNLLFDEAQGYTFVVMDDLTQIFDARSNRNFRAILCLTIAGAKITELFCCGPVPTLRMVD